MATERTRRDFLKLSAAGLAATATVEALPARSALHSDVSHPGDISIWVTHGRQRFEKTDGVSWMPSAGAASTANIRLDPAKRFQEILGFGAAFTDASCFLFNQLPPDGRAQLFHELFHPAELGLNVCRTCMGASDYSTEIYGFDEGEPDPELKRFSIEHDRKYLLPVLRQARQTNPDLFLFSSPWSPPGWMKAGGSMLGGSMRKKHFSSYAQYFVKFLEAYTAEGIGIQAVTSQNEVDTDQDGRMPACLWGQEYEIEFVKQHLGPALKSKGMSTKIWLLDHNYNLWGRVICCLDDPDLRAYTNAVAWHGYVGTADMVSKVHAAHPDAEMHWTEGGPDYTSPTYATDWAQWGRTFTDALRNWCQSITGWNLALDERGRPNIGPFPCGGLVTIHSQTQQITRSGQYWALAHFSRMIRRGARRFDSHGDLPEISHVACQNPDGQNLLVLSNRGDRRTVELRLNSRAASLTLEADSLMTAVWR
jgi:glucosylceramidase